MRPALLLRIGLVLATLLLGACSVLDYFKTDKDEDLEPNELVDFDAEVTLRRLWSVNVDSGQGDKYNRLKPALTSERIYAAGNDGLVLAVDTESGRTLWRQRLDDAITGGVGYGNDIVLVGSENSQVVALAAATGDILWQTTVSSEVLSAPATNGRIVVVQSIDGKLAGLNAQTGAQLWLYESTVPALSLRGESSPLIIENFVIAAFANGSVASIALDNGTLRWDQRVAVPTGNSEIDRLVDIDGDLVLNDEGMLLVSTYQGFLAVIDPATGQTRWRVEESSSAGASFGFGNIYIVDADDAVRAYRTTQETPMWENTELRLRRLSAPLGFSNYVAVGDFEGYVHLLSQVDGRFVGRIKVDGDGIRSRMQSFGGTLFVFGNSGKLVALRVQ